MVKPKLLDQVKYAVRVRHMSYRTEQANVLKREIGWVNNVERAKKPTRLPVVFSKREVTEILLRLEGTKWLIASLLYGSGLRLLDCLRLRSKNCSDTRTYPLPWSILMS